MIIYLFTEKNNQFGCMATSLIHQYITIEISTFPFATVEIILTY